MIKIYRHIFMIIFINFLLSSDFCDSLVFHNSAKIIFVTASSLSHYLLHYHLKTFELPLQIEILN